MTALCTPVGVALRSVARSTSPASCFATVGMGFVLWLVAAELLIIGNICEYCTGVHIVTFALFICMVTTIPAMLGWTERLSR